MSAKAQHPLLQFAHPFTHIPFYCNNLSVALGTVIALHFQLGLNQPAFKCDLSTLRMHSP